MHEYANINIAFIVVIVIFTVDDLICREDRDRSPNGTQAETSLSKGTGVGRKDKTNTHASRPPDRGNISIPYLLSN